MGGIPGISIGTGFGSGASGERGGISVKGAVSEAKKQKLERQINDDKQKLDRTDTHDTAAKAKISTELSKFERQLNKIKDDEKQEKSEQTEAERKRRFDSFECQTCKNRRYQDVSDDPGVSFQSAQHVDPSAAYAKVKAHEQEHVARNKTEAESKGAKIAYQTVTIKRGICPECGRSYVAGGVTKTVTKADTSSQYTVGMFDSEKGKGKELDAVA